MAAAYAQINPDNVRWARERANLTLGMLARKLGVPEEKVESWETGQKPITFKQAKSLAEKTFIPFGYLFLKENPVDKLPIPDLRTKEGEEIRRPSAELYKILKIVLARQSWYKEYLKQQGIEKRPFGNNFNLQSAPLDIVADMRRVLDVPAHPTRGTWEEYQRQLVKKIESIGILVMRHGDLGHFSKPLSVDEFRGFAVVDDMCPLIFVNQADSPAARLFTLIHELAHIWIGSSGISDGSLNPHRAEEVLCNRVAAEFLVPANEFTQMWDQDIEWEHNMPALENHFHVSQWVLARRALDQGFITSSEYHGFINRLKRLYEEREQKGSPGYYRTKRSQISEEFSRALVSEALSGRVLLRDAGDLLGLKPNQIVSYAKELGI